MSPLPQTVLRGWRPLKVSILSGVVHAGDAISETLLADVEALDRWASDQRINVDLQVYCLESSVADPRVRAMADWREVLAQPHFQATDVYLHHFGVFSPIHKAMDYARRDATVAVTFHNVTPPQYLPRAAEPLIHQSFQQMVTFAAADRLIATSEFTAAELRRCGALGEITVSPLFGPNAAATPRPSPVLEREDASDAPLRLVSIGRLVGSKGLDLLVEAAQRLASDGTAVDLTIAWLSRYSDPEVTARLETLSAASPEPLRVHIQTDLSRDALRDLLGQADAFVMPSRHEGFGMPVIEALSAGVPVICSNAGALPEVAGDCALTFVSGDAVALHQALAMFAESLGRHEIAVDGGSLTADAWSRRVQAHLPSLDRRAYQDRFIAIFETLATAKPLSTAPRLRQLQATAADVVGDYAVADTAEALDQAAIGAAIAAAVTDAFQTSTKEGASELLGWALGRSPSDQEVADWVSQARSTGVDRATERLLASSDAGERRAIGRYVQARLAKRTAAAPLLADDPVFDDAPFRMLLDQPMTDGAFIAQAYRLAFDREVDSNGLKGKLEDLERGLSRHAVVAALLTSDEFRAGHPDVRVEGWDGPFPEPAVQEVSEPEPTAQPDTLDG